MQPNMDKWLEDAKIRIKEFKKSHALQRVHLELAFETAPRDSRYSNGLIDMMRKEEVIIAKDPNSPVTKSVSQKVDENLRAETRGFFNKSVQKNVKRWAALKDKFDQETQQFTKGLSNELKSHSNIKGVIPIRNNRTPTPEELDEEADRLECDYNRNWYKYENFNLQEAFKSQNNRIENDWGTHERTLEEEFQARREKIAGPMYGRGASSNTAAAAQQVQDPRWQHPEKQKTLIHTAPVLSPTKMQMGASDSAGWARGKDQGAINSELERIQSEYEVAVAAMQKQKGDAKRWLLRQQVRLQAQAVEVQVERNVIGDLQFDDLAQLQALTRALNSAGHQ